MVTSQTEEERHKDGKLNEHRHGILDRIDSLLRREDLELLCELRHLVHVSAPSGFGDLFLEFR